MLWVHREIEVDMDNDMEEFHFISFLFSCSHEYPFQKGRANVIFTFIRRLS